MTVPQSIMLMTNTNQPIVVEPCEKTCSITPVESFAIYLNKFTRLIPRKNGDTVKFGALVPTYLRQIALVGAQPERLVEDVARVAFTTAQFFHQYAANRLPIPGLLNDRLKTLTNITVAADGTTTFTNVFDPTVVSPGVASFAALTRITLPEEATTVTITHRQARSSGTNSTSTIKATFGPSDCRTIDLLILGAGSVGRPIVFPVPSTLLPSETAYPHEIPSTTASTITITIGGISAATTCVGETWQIGYNDDLLQIIN